MAPSCSVFTFLVLSFFFLPVSNAQPSSSSRPGGLVFPVNRDSSTLQYVTKLSLGKIPINVVVDLGRKSSWIYSSAGCASTSISGVVTAQSNNLKNGEWVSGPNVTARGISVGCEKNASVLRGLAKGAKGIVGLGRSSSSLASQFSAAFRFPKKFALELKSTTIEGSLYFGDGPYTSQNFRQPLTYTPLLTNYFFPSDYFIDVKSIDMDGSNVTINKGLLSINKSNGVGGTKFSTLVPYTTMETSIYKAFTSVYIKTAKARGMSTIAPVAPFTVCFNGSTIETRPDGFLVPEIFLRLPNNVAWIMTGPNNSPLMFIKENVYCLPFVNGGSKSKTSIVIGGHQMEFSILEFDIAKSRVGYSPPIQV
ncbi:protein ASPARTIC PROTEASE IN GUARD CELL 2-like [Papaver somniferum]|uniref:protein ASPARTIC PROTEASE IN GUARD CELL 2-like n=1 Tax=Papaver somniferum TaxID=3469 RepID=UPI000E704769|nr:protein ASPARTIC PROTEASE IN GUARD CELL 2-like [Papaver somniferum]